MSAATKSETLFESFLARNQLLFEKIEEQSKSRRDYLFAVGSQKFVFEVKEPSEDDNFDVIKGKAAPHIKSHSRALGDHGRRKIEGSKNRFGTVLSKDSLQFSSSTTTSTRYFRRLAPRIWISSAPCMADTPCV